MQQNHPDTRTLAGENCTAGREATWLAAEMPIHPREIIARASDFDAASSSEETFAASLLSRTVAKE